MTELDAIFEKITIQEFLRNQGLFENAIITYPEPHGRPDCIFQSGENKGWIEVTSVFRLWKKFTPAQGYKKIFGTCEYECHVNEGEYIAQVIAKVVERITEKNLNSNYEKQKQELGPGTLLIYINDVCFHWQDHLAKVINQDNYKHLSLSNFKSVYIYNRPIIVEQISSNPPAWSPKILTNCEDFHLILKKQ